MRLFIRLSQNLTNWTGEVTGPLVIAITFVLVWEVLLRYVFHSPTIWAHEVSGFLYGAYFLLGGAYTLNRRAHVNVGIFYDNFPPRVRAIVALVTWALFYLFCGVLLWRSGQAAWVAVLRMEYSSTAWGPPTWPIKLIVPLAAGLMLLEGLTKTINDLYIAIKGHELVVKTEKRGGV